MKTIGAQYSGNKQCCFTVWAPLKKSMLLRIVQPEPAKFSMQKNKDGYFQIILDNILPGTEYYLMPDDEKEYPDPASFYQPLGVHKASEVIDQQAFQWHDDSWRGIPFKDLVLYEIHTGTFTHKGTFEAIIPRLDELYETGINAIELMPVAQFPGERNWGYDSVYPFAVQNSYGGPQGLKKLVDACHQKGIAVFLDVVYNHLGPEGNYLGKFGPYFTNKYHTPWGDAINYDGEYSDGVRNYVLQNILFWYEVYHIDGLRLDAVHAMYDDGAVTIWQLIDKQRKLLQQKTGRSLYLIAESDLNSPRVVKPVTLGGYAFNAQWLDDFHHALYTMLHSKGIERYEDFGTIQQLAKAYKDGFVHSGEYVKFRKRRYGASSTGISGDKLIVFNQNHDQIGNRVLGERLSMLVDFERQKIAAAAVFLSPYIPMLFMGEEYADDSPFFYFVSHSDEKLINAVRQGRKAEFEKFREKAMPPDPQQESTFIQSKLKWEKRNQGQHHLMLQWHQHLIFLRRAHAALQNFDKDDLYVEAIGEGGLVLHRKAEDEQLLILLNFSERKMIYTVPASASAWLKLLDSKEAEWMVEKTELLCSPSSVMANDLLEIMGCGVVVYHLKIE